MNMNKWLQEIMESDIKKPMPILSFPCVKLLGITVQELISDSDKQAEGMKVVADRVDSLASVSFMDLSLEAEAFGADIKVSDDEVPTVTGVLVKSIEEAEALEIPTMNSGRLPIYIDGIKKAKELITDRPVLAGVIGPFSLAGRLVDVSTAMKYCKRQPELLHIVLRKATDFLITYIKEYKKAGANGIAMAEPLAGLLSPRFIKEFSEPYVREIADAIRDENFIMVYHNCGNSTLSQVESISSTHCDAYHFGNAIDMKEMLEKFPSNVLVMGNIDPASQFTNGTVDSMTEATKALLKECSVHKNFVISSGCDIPPVANWDNIDAFFEATKEFYATKA